MAPRPKRITRLGEALRAARAAVSMGQLGLAQRVFVSSRMVSRWENGVRPAPDHAERILGALAGAPPHLVQALADALGVDVEIDAPPDPSALLPEQTFVPPENAAPPPVVATQPQMPPPPPAHAAPSSAELRASLDAIVYAASEQRDILPRHLRAFGVELLQAADRLGLTAKDAASLVAVPEKTIAKAVPPS